MSTVHVIDDNWAMTKVPATILIVDDEGPNCRLLQGLLGPEGYVTRTAATGEEALASIAHDSPDLILLDVLMPGMDGRQVAAALKADPATRQIPIIMVTAQNDRASRLAALAAGAEEFLTKPVDRAELWLRVRNLLRLKELGDLLENHRVNLQAQVQARTADLTEKLEELARTQSDLQGAEVRLLHQAMHDPVTGLPNRALFLDRLALALADAARSGLPLTVYFIDLDGFKRVNDSLGHQAGDGILREAAARLSSALRPGDTVARFAGDEFVVLTPQTPDQLGTVVSMADRILGALHDPPLQLGAHVVRASMGLAISHRGASPEQLVGEADAAMYLAKRNGGARWELFGPKLRDQLRQRRTTENRLRRALAEDRVQVRYQPVVDLASGQVVGAEALVRLKRGNGSLQAPATFIPTAEESGLVIPLGQRVLEHACQQPQVWQDRTRRPWFVSVNVSPRQLADSGLLATTTAALDAANLPPEQLCLEITEEAILDIGPDILKTLDRLRTMGVRIGVDDFGTGHAAMSYVRHLPLDFIKIDQSFVAGMSTDVRDLAMVEATLALSHRLGLQSIAEGIETPTHWAQLRDLGCDHGQGFLFAKPTTSQRITAREMQFST